MMIVEMQIEHSNVNGLCNCQSLTNRNAMQCKAMHRSPDQNDRNSKEKVKHYFIVASKSMPSNGTTAHTRNNGHILNSPATNDMA